MVYLSIRYWDAPWWSPIGVILILFKILCLLRNSFWNTPVMHIVFTLLYTGHNLRSLRQLTDTRQDMLTRPYITISYWVRFVFYFCVLCLVLSMNVEFYDVKSKTHLKSGENHQEESFQKGTSLVIVTYVTPKLGKSRCIFFTNIFLQLFSKTNQGSIGIILHFYHCC